MPNKSMKTLDQQWQQFCHLFAEKTVDLIEQNPNDPLAQQSKISQINDLSNTLANHGLVNLMAEGFALLNKEGLGHGIQFAEELTQAIEHVDLNDFVNHDPLPDVEKILQLDPSHLLIIEKRADKALSATHYNQAAPLLAILAFLKGSQSAVWFKLAFALYQMEQYPLAIDCVSVAHEQQVNQPEYSLLLAACYRSIEDKVHAKEALQGADKVIRDNHLTLAQEWQDFDNQLRVTLE